MMKILVDIGHPAHVHFFKNFIKEMNKMGHSFLITARDKDVTKNLLDKYGFEYTVISERKESKNTNKFFELIKMGFELIKRDYGIFRLAKKFKPDILMGIGGESVAQVSKLIRAKSIIFTDSEPAKIINSLAFPFADAICTPSCFKHDLGNKHVKYDVYHELAYLHPHYFTPNPAVLDEIGLSKDDTFIILRFVSWSASHDVGQHGIRDKVGLVKELEKHGKVLITSEARLPKELEKYKITVSPEKLHDLLYYAHVFAGDSQTMATEAGVLGTPAVRCNTFVGENDMGYFIELEQKYGLIFNYSNPDKAIEKAVELIQKPNLKEEWQEKRKKLLKDKIDVTAFMVWFIENYPDSFKEMKENPRIQYRFR